MMTLRGAGSCAGLLLLSTVFTVACSSETANKSDAEGNDSEVVARDALLIARELPEQCASPEIVRLKRPVASDGTAQGTWSYGYRFKAPATEGAPVIVALPGGPGGTFTSMAMDWLPEGWGYLLTDPRGVGCNTLASLPDEKVSGAFF